MLITAAGRKNSSAADRYRIGRVSTVGGPFASAGAERGVLIGWGLLVDGGG
jgi:hypothetical protein